MKRIIKSALPLLLALALLLACAAPASAVYASERGLSVTKNKGYTQDGQYYISFTIASGRLSGCDPSSTNTKIKANLYNSSGKSVVSWKERTLASSTTTTQLFSYDWDNNLPSDSYTLKLLVTLSGEEYGYARMPQEEKYEWSYSFTHTQPAKIWLGSVSLVANNDGSYSNKISFGHSGAKGRFVSLEVYNSSGKLVYKASGSTAISYTSGSYNFFWNGFPNGGGPQCGSGNYTIKYWLNNGNPKQSTVWMDIY
jgi:flagellar hook assembly protein FlgD